MRAFLEHARRRDRSYELTALDAGPLVEILQHLDGLPLAIELVAGQVAMLPLAAVRDRLGRALDLVTGAGRVRGGPAAHPAADHPLVLRPADLAAADAAPRPGRLPRRRRPGHRRGARRPRWRPATTRCGCCSGLVDASLLDVDPGRTRYRLLFTVRAFLLEEVAALGELAATEDRFLRWAVRAAEEIGAGLRRSCRGARPTGGCGPSSTTCAQPGTSPAPAGLMDARVRITLAVDQPAIWRDLRELWSWCLELADAPETDGHPREVEILGAGAEARAPGGRLRPGGRAGAPRARRRRGGRCRLPGGGAVLVGPGRRRALPRRLRRRRP